MTLAKMLSYHGTLKLRERLAVLHGSKRGYVENAAGLIPAAAVGVAPEGASTEIDPDYLSKLVTASQATPIWLAVALTRIAKEDYDLGRDDAISAATAEGWFTLEGGGEDG
jgi:hypothetical protein